MKREWKLVEVEGRIWIPFDWVDPTPGGSNLGRAEFQVCIKFNRGKISEFWVYPVQTRLDTYWHINSGNEYGDFAVTSMNHLQDWGAWLISYCKEHKATMIRVYAPTGAKYLEIDRNGLRFWDDDYSK